MENSLKREKLGKMFNFIKDKSVDLTAVECYTVFGICAIYINTHENKTGIVICYGSNFSLANWNLCFFFVCT